MRNPHKYHYQRSNSAHRFHQGYQSDPPGHSGRGTPPHPAVKRARVETRRRHRRRY